jgi:hypothetical protein
MMVLTVVVAALGMASELAEARDRGFSFRHFSGHAGPKLHLRDPGFKFHRGGFVGKGRAFKSQRFGHVGQHGFASKFGHAPEFKSRHFGHLRQRGLVLEFGDGDVMLRFSHVPFKHGRSGRGTIAASPSKIRAAFTRSVRACRGRKAAEVAGCKTAPRQKPSLESSSRWVFDTCQSCCAAGIPKTPPVLALALTPGQAFPGSELLVVI